MYTSRTLIYRSNPNNLVTSDIRTIALCWRAYLAEKGVPTELIAKAMGHSAEVCKKHYSGFMIHDDGIEMIKKFVG